MKRLNIDGYIIDDIDRWLYDLLEIPNLTLAKMRAFLDDAAGDEIELAINCNGGDVFTAASIYAELRNYSGPSTARIIGLSASASSFLMVGCKKVTVSPMGAIMVHNSQAYASGDHREMEHTAEVLKQIDETIRNAYEAKTGKSRDELKRYMDKETWLTPQDALELGIVDEIELKEGETLSEPKHSMLQPARVAASFNPHKMHEIAERLKKPADPEQPNDRGGESRPIADPISDPLSEQKTRFLNIRKNLYK